jgi:HEPN domain-containing protein
VTGKQKERSDYFFRQALVIAREAKESFQSKEFARVVRKSHEAVELWLKGKHLELGIEPAKIHDLNALSRRLPIPSGISEDDLLYLTSERIPSFYGADDVIPDQAYTEEDGNRCLAILAKIGI